MSLNKMTAWSIAGLVAMALAAPVLAQGDMLSGADAIARRQELMTTIGGTMRSAGGATGDARLAAAQTIVDSFAEVGMAFPEDSQEGDTKALPAIWTDQGGFMQAYTTAVTAAADLLAAAESGDEAAWGLAFKDLGAACGNCHTQYRAN
ncbi:MAG: cytochrome c [Alphaproteobacteria bacterium]|nr:cytochrome c [Alphaproteobacteria bacterium]